MNWISISSITTTETATQAMAEEPKPILTSDPGLTTFAESANETQVTMVEKRSVERNISQPYNIRAPLDILERNYLIGNFNWTPTLGYTTFAFPQAFSTITTITDTMKRYKYWRATIHVEIKLATTPYHQGSLMACWYPVPGSSTVYSDIVTMSGMPSATILSASTQDSVSFDIPYMHHYDWMDWATYANTPFHSFVAIQQLNPLTATSSGISTSCPVLVYASMKNVEVTGYVSQSKSGGPKFKTNTEAEAKQSGFDVKSAVSTVSKIARSAPVVGEIWSPIADALNAFSGNLSKPVMQAPSPMTRPYGEVNLAEATEDVTQLSLYPNAQLAQGAEMFGMETSHMSVVRIAQTPMLFDQVTFDGTTTNWSTLVYPKNTGTLLKSDYLRAVSKSFRFWRGSIKFLVHFCLPAFYQVRVQFALNYNATSVNDGDLTTRVVDIKGNTWQTIEVPYLYPTTWKDNDQQQLNLLAPTFTIKQLTPILGSTAIATPKVYVNIFRAAGEDFQLAVPRSWPLVASSKTEETTTRVGYKDQMLLRKKFLEPFEPIIDGVKQSIEKSNCMPEVAGTVNDVIKRAAPNPLAPSTIVYSRANLDLDLFSAFRRFFLFWRGSRTVRRQSMRDIQGLSPTLAYLNTGAGVYTYSDAFTLFTQYGLYTQMLEGCSVPYYSSVYYQPMPSPSLLQLHQTMYLNPPLDLTLSGAIPSTNEWMINAGDDFVMMFLVPYQVNSLP